MVQLQPYIFLRDLFVCRITSDFHFIMDLEFPVNVFRFYPNVGFGSNNYKLTLLLYNFSYFCTPNYVSMLTNTPVKGTHSHSHLHAQVAELVDALG